jgi:hypothetical protein
MFFLTAASQTNQTDSELREIKEKADPNRLVGFHPVFDK